MPGASDDQEKQRLYRVAGAGMEFFSTVLGGTLGGWLLDRWLDTAPWLLLSGIGVGFATGLFTLVRLSRENEKRAKAEREKKKEQRG